jgi:putative endonuclease
MPFFVYILECSDNTLYTGSTHDLQKRLHDHNATGAGAKYTRGRRPVKLVYTRKCTTLARARKIEAEIKRLTRKEKANFIKKFRER